MRLSKFNFMAKGSSEEGKTAVFNTLTRGLAVLEDQVLEEMRSGKGSRLTPDEVRSLEDMGILVPEGMNEDMFFDVYYNQVRHDNTSIRLTVLTTLNCNFSCPYCYEGDLTYGSKKQMTMETADRLVEWIKKKATEGRVSKVKIDFMGGEPLMNIPVIERIAAGIAGFCDDRGIDLVAIIISNGYLLTKETAQRMADAGVEMVRVTIDGPEEIHNSFRFLRESGGKTYKTIIKNLQESRDIIGLSICGTYTKETATEIPRLLDDLIAAGLGPDAIHKVQFAPMSPSETGGAAANFDKRCIPTTNLHEVVNIGHRELIKRGFGNYAEPEFAPCAVVCSGDLTINWDGTIYKCPCLVDHKGYEVGSISEDLSYNAEMVRCLGYSTFENEECRACNLLPLCLGGCRYLALVKSGNFHSRDCDRKSLEAITLENVRRMAREG